MFVNLQREHWRKSLEDESRERENDAYSAGLDKNQYKVERLEDEIDDCHDRLKALKSENDQLRRKLDKYKAGYARASGGGASRGKDTSRPRASQRQRSPQRVQPSAHAGTGKGKQKERSPSPSSPPRKKSRTIYETDSDDSSVILAELTGNTPLNSQEEDLVAATIASRIQHARDSHRIEGEATASSSMGRSTAPAANPNPSHDRARTHSLRPLIRGQTPPGGWGKWIGDPAPFRLHHIREGAFLCKKFGHACLSSQSHWSIDAKSLWIQQRTAGTWFWLKGKRFQVAREASQIPFDQRSLAQRWVVREATLDGLLPLDECTAEPDVELLASEDALPNYLRRDPDGRYNIYDLTAWMFITMTQPDLAEGTVAWYWELASSLFSEQGRFGDIGSAKFSTTDAPPTYAPVRFVHEGEYQIQDVAYHLYGCGLTCRDANTHFYDWAAIYRAHYPSTTPPNWSTVPTPRPHEARPTLTQRRGKKKGGKAASKSKPLAERIDGFAPQKGGTSAVPTYDEAPPTGSPRPDTEMSNVNNEPKDGSMAVDQLPSSPMGPG